MSRLEQAILENDDVLIQKLRADLLKMQKTPLNQNKQSDK